MALAWARKKDTPYVQDPVFVANFLRDFSAALGVEPVLRLEEIDFSECYAYVDREREIKANMTKEERKALAAERRARREALKAKYGYAIVNGQRVELGTYMVEPSGIFMGRGQHPLRGRWKEGAKQSDITLNLSPDAPPVEGDWAEIVWQPESMWVARWKDKLTGKLKYIWLSDTAPIKQEREAQKFDKAEDLDAELERVREQIQRDLVAPDPRKRMIATVCYLIDALCLRVGDEKDPDEADTVGATTLRPEHVKIRPDGVVEFKFLGKDSVEWHKTLEPPQVVLRNLEELIRNARPSRNGEGGHPTRDLPQLFPDITSRDVNAYLSGIMPGLTAKVFRTHHATRVVQESLNKSGVRAEDPEYLKWKAASLANWEAAVLCNHTKQYKGNWERTKERYAQRRQRAEERIERYRQRVKELREKLRALRQEAREKIAAAKTPERRQKVRERYEKRIAKAQARLEAARQRRTKAEVALAKIKAQFMMASKKRTWNLGTSLKSYIDPRVYYEWGKQVDYDVLARYYPAALRRKFAWVRALDEEELSREARLSLRTCMSADLEQVAQLFALAQEEGLDIPVEPTEIGERYLPALGESWREAFIAVQEDGEVVAFVALGPEWQEEEQLYLDIFALVHPSRRSVRLGQLLAAEVSRRLRGYEVQHPKARYELRPRDERWFSLAPGLAEALGLLEEEAASEDELEEAEVVLS